MFTQLGHFYFKKWPSFCRKRQINNLKPKYIIKLSIYTIITEKSITH